MTRRGHSEGHGRRDDPVRAYLAADRNARDERTGRLNEPTPPANTATGDSNAPPDWDRLSVPELELLALLTRKLEGVPDPQRRQLVIEPAQWLPRSSDSDQRYYTRTFRIEAMPPTAMTGADAPGATAPGEMTLLSDREAMNQPRFGGPCALGPFGESQPSNHVAYHVWPSAQMADVK